jgi:AcrR family transcriptional regulator
VPNVAVSRPPLNLVARRQERVRRELAAAAGELFKENGYDATTVEDIAAAAEVSPRTFYRLFPTKGDVIIELARTAWGDIVTAFAERPVDEPLFASVEAVLIARFTEIDRKALRSFEDLLAHSQELRARWLEETRRQQDLFAGVLAGRVGGAPDDLRTQVIAAAILATHRTALEVWSTHAGGEGPIPTLREAMDLVAPMFAEFR